MLFDRLITAAREAGLLCTDATQLIDSSHILGAAGVRDTYTLIRGGIRKLLRALGYMPGRHAELGERLGWYLDPAAPEKPELDWTDPAERAEHLRRLVRDARAALTLVPDEEQRAAVREAASLLTKIVADDVEEGPPPGPKRRGRPPEEELTPAAEDGSRGRGGRAGSGGCGAATAAGGGAGPGALGGGPGDALRAQERAAALAWLQGPRRRRAGKRADHPRRGPPGRRARWGAGERIHGAAGGARRAASGSAYGTADARADLGERDIEVVAKLRPITDTKHLGKDQFVIDLSANDGQGSVTCPAEVTTTDFRMARD